VAQLVVSRLNASDYAALARLLERDPLPTVYMRSEMRLNPAMANWWGVGGGGELRAAFLGGPLVVPWIPDPGDAPALVGALHQQGLPRMLVGPATSVRALATALTPWRTPVEARDPQPLLIVDRVPAGGTGPLRRGIRADLGVLTEAAAAMHREEMGVDPMAVDSAGWRSRMTGLVDRGWSYIWREGDEVLFKAELSGWTPEAVQIQGVWTSPRWRGRGVGSAGMTSLCAILLRDVPVCSLYVNNYNAVALRMYHRLGFRQAGEFATLMY
jgi:GNAT superfamily N-acetyltransferase